MAAELRNREENVMQELTLGRQRALGCVVALLVIALIDPGGQLAHIDTAAVTVGVFGGIGLDRFLRG